MEKQKAVLLTNQQRIEIIQLLDSNSPNRARGVANFMESLTEQEIVMAVDADQALENLTQELTNFAEVQA